MKKIIKPFNENEIKTLKKHLNLGGIASKHGLNPKSNYIYRILRTGCKQHNSIAHNILKELKDDLDKLKDTSV